MTPPPSPEPPPARGEGAHRRCGDRAGLGKQLPTRLVTAGPPAIPRLGSTRLEIAMTDPTAKHPRFILVRHRGPRRQGHTFHRFPCIRAARARPASSSSPASSSRPMRRSPTKARSRSGWLMERHGPPPLAGRDHTTDIALLRVDTAGAGADQALGRHPPRSARSRWSFAAERGTADPPRSAIYR